MNEKQRAEFEKWAKEKGCSTERHNDLNQHPLDWYACESTDLAWESWQAAIASVVVDIKNLTSASYTSSGVVYLSDVANAIENAGVKHNDE